MGQSGKAGAFSTPAPVPHPKAASSSAAGLAGGAAAGGDGGLVGFPGLAGDVGVERARHLRRRPLGRRLAGPSRRRTGGRVRRLLSNPETPSRSSSRSSFWDATVRSRAVVTFGVLVEGGGAVGRADEGAGDALQVDLHRLLALRLSVSSLAQRDHVFLGVLADGGRNRPGRSRRCVERFSARPPCGAAASTISRVTALADPTAACGQRAELLRWSSERTWRT